MYESLLVHAMKAAEKDRFFKEALRAFVPACKIKQEYPVFEPGEYVVEARKGEQTITEKLKASEAMCSASI